MVRRFSRRQVIATGAAAALAGLAHPSQVVHAAEETESHGISAFGDLKYPAAFKQFDYVDANAPKGGLFSEVVSRHGYNGSFLTFNSLNAFILRGEGAYGMDLTFASLMARANDEPDAMYGLAARGVRISADGLTYTFLMRDRLSFHDGSPLTAHDVAFSLNTLKEKGHPIIAQLLRDFEGAQASDDATLVARFKAKRGRDVPLLVASLPIFSRVYYAKRPFEESTLDIPLGSGPYRVGPFEQGRYIEFQRVADWWGADLPVSRGQNNFDRIRYEYYRDREVGFEGFTAKNYLFREEFTARVWATRYDFPAIRDGRVKREMLPDDTPSGAQGWIINTRLPKFGNAQLREALIDAFDFEWTNKTLMYGAYKRTHSVFQNSPMMAESTPSAGELKLLERFRGRVPDEVFHEPYVPPVTDGSGQDRSLLRRASDKLREAGFPIRDGKRIGPSGAPLTIEFLLEEPAFEPHHALYIKNLATLGIAANIRLVDPVQYRKRVDDFDFDMTVHRFGFSSTPGDSLRSYFSSHSAGVKGTQNLAGIAHPAIDAMIEAAIAAKSREDLTFACKALDRLVRAGRYWVPQWYLAAHRVAYWDVFSRPPGKPHYGRGVPEIWWYDKDKAARLERGG